MTAGLKIVRGHPGHAPFVRELSARVFGRFGDYDRTLPPLLPLPSVRTLVAEMAGRPLGFAMITCAGLPAGETELLAVAVLPGQESRGVGRRLLDHVAGLARAAAAPGAGAVVRLTVAEDNHRAIHVFTAAGYTRSAAPPGRYPGGQASIEMCKHVASDGDLSEERRCL